KGKAELHPQDRIVIGSCAFEFEFDEPPSDRGLVIRAELSVIALPADLMRQDAAAKLQAVLDIAHHLAQATDTDALLDRLLEHLLGLFRTADRGLVLLCDGDRLTVRAARTR